MVGFQINIDNVLKRGRKIIAFIVSKTLTRMWENVSKDSSLLGQRIEEEKSTLREVV